MRVHVFVCLVFGTRTDMTYSTDLFQNLMTDANENTHGHSTHKISSMVEIQGRGCPCQKSLVEVASEGNRFPVPPTPEEAFDQIKSRSKWIEMIGLEQFNAQTEQEMENWVDSAAVKIKRHRICVELFRNAWEGVSDETYSKVIGKIEAQTYEQLVDGVALALFPVSRYVCSVECELFVGARQSTVLQADQWITEKASRYIRLCNRRLREYSISNDRVRDIYYACIPAVVEHEVRKRHVQTFNEIKTAAHLAQGDMVAMFGRIPELTSNSLAYAATPMDTDISGTCKACGGAHKTGTCGFSKSRCFTCGELGHIKSVCPNFALKDSLGRIRTLLKNKPGSTEVLHKQDRTVNDKVLTAEAVMRFLRENAARRSERAAERRNQNKPDGKNSNKKRKSKMTTEPAAVAADAVAEEDETMDQEMLALINEIASWGDDAQLTK